jgi:hypothetical protein
LNALSVSRTFVVEVDSPLGREDVRGLILTKLSIPLGKAEYRIESENETMVAYARTYRPYWMVAVLLCWLVLPLLLLLVEQTDRVILTLVEGTEGTRIIVVGDGPTALARHFEQLNRLEPQAK